MCILFRKPEFQLNPNFTHCDVVTMARAQMHTSNIHWIPILNSNPNKRRKKREFPLLHSIHNWNIATRGAFSPCRHCISSSHVTSSYRTVIGNAKHIERAKFAVPNSLSQTPVARNIWTKCVSRLDTQFQVSNQFFFLFFVRSFFSQLNRVNGMCARECVVYRRYSFPML